MSESIIIVVMAAESEALNITPTNSNIYWNMLKDLNMDVKLDLIAKLSNSLINRESDNTKTNWTESFAGKWQDSRSADEIATSIRQSRHFVEHDIDL